MLMVLLVLFSNICQMRVTKSVLIVPISKCKAGPEKAVISVTPLKVLFLFQSQWQQFHSGTNKKNTQMTVGVNKH